MKEAIAKYLQYLQSVKNSSPHTILNYRRDLEQFLAYLSPPGARPPGLTGVAHPMIREFVAHLHDHGLAKSSIARKLAALRSFFKYCVREGHLKENPARLVPTPKLPKRIPSVVSAEEMNGFLNQLGATGQAAIGGRASSTKRAFLPPASAVKPQGRQSRSVPVEESFLLRRDRALLELLYAAVLRCIELTGLNLADMEQKERMLRVRGKGNKERIVPYGAKAQEALEKYCPLREQLLEQRDRGSSRQVPQAEAVFLTSSGRRLTQRSVGRIVKKYVRMANVNWD